MSKVIQRVEKEKTELDDKLMQLHLFMNGEDYMGIPAESKRMLQRQYEVMDKYSCVLRDRLVYMKKETT